MRLAWGARVKSNKITTMKAKTVLFLMLMPFLPCQNGWGAKSNYYLEITKSGIEIGQYSKRNFKKERLKSYSKDQVDIGEISKFFTSKEQGHVLFYFHSMWGGVKPYHKNSLRKLNEIQGIDKTISIVWHADAMGYEGSWLGAIQQGRFISPIVSQLCLDSTGTYFVLCHSMGHRFFEGVMEALKDSAIRFQAVFFAAADLDVDVFSKNLAVLPVVSGKTVLYINRKDRLLKLSRRVHKRERLGLNAADHLSELQRAGNVEVVDITDSKRSLFTLKSSHIYFKNRKSVLRDMEYVITKNEVLRLEHFKKKQGIYIALK